jgi:hypothetical protein
VSAVIRHTSKEAHNCVILRNSHIHRSIKDKEFLRAPCRRIKRREVKHLHSFLTSAQYGGERSTSRPGRFIPGKEHPSPLNIWLGRPLNRPGRREEDISHDPTGISAPDGLARSLINIRHYLGSHTSVVTCEIRPT